MEHSKLFNICPIHINSKRLMGCEDETQLFIRENNIKSQIEEIRPDIIMNTLWSTSGDYRNCSLNESFKELSVELYNLSSSFPIIQYFCFGSSSEYGRDPGECFENAPALSTTFLDDLYSRNKATALAKIHEINSVSEMPFTWIRLFNVFGMNQNANSLFRQVARQSLEFGFVHIKEPYSNLDFVSQYDVVTACELLAQQEYYGVYNVGSGEPRNIGELIRHLIDKSGSKPRLYLEHSVPRTSYASQQSAIFQLGWVPRRSVQSINLKDYI